MVEDFENLRAIRGELAAQLAEIHHAVDAETATSWLRERDVYVKRVSAAIGAIAIRMSEASSRMDALIGGADPVLREILSLIDKGDARNIIDLPRDRS